MTRTRIMRYEVFGSSQEFEEWQESLASYYEIKIFNVIPIISVIDTQAPSRKESRAISRHDVLVTYVLDEKTNPQE